MNRTVYSEEDSFKPANDRVLLRLEVPELKTKSGIILPTPEDTNKSSRNYVGIVKALGDRVPKDCGFALGDRVLFTGGTQYDLYKEQTAGAPSCCFVSWYDIIAVAEGKGTLENRL